MGDYEYPVWGQSRVLHTWLRTSESSRCGCSIWQAGVALVPSAPSSTGRSAFMCMIKDSIDLSLANLAFVGRGTANPLSIQRGFGHLWSLRQNASSALPKPRHWLFGGGQRSRGRAGHVPGWLSFLLLLHFEYSCILTVSGGANGNIWESTFQVSSCVAGTFIICC